MAFNDLSYLELWWPFCSAERNHLCNFNRGYPEEQVCEIILKFGSMVQDKMLFKDSLS